MRQPAAERSRDFGEPLFNGPRRNHWKQKSNLSRRPLPYRKFRITYRSLGNIRIRAYLGVPIRGEGPERELPCIVTAPGYGGSQQGAMLDDCQRGYAVLQVYPRSQGESADLWKIDGPDKLTWRVDQPEGYYYQGAYVDVMRGH